jgi:hypothetical protein
MENRTFNHDRSTNVNNPMPERKKPSGALRFMGGVITTMALGMTITGLLLYSAIKSNQEHMARIATLEEVGRQQVALTAERNIGGSTASTVSTATANQSGATTPAAQSNQASAQMPNQAAAPVIDPKFSMRHGGHPNHAVTRPHPASQQPHRAEAEVQTEVSLGEEIVEMD